MPVALPSLTGQVPHDVEQAILALQRAIEALQADVAALRRQQTPTDAVARTKV